MPKIDKYRFKIMIPSWRVCDKCQEKRSCVVVRFWAPFKKDVRICYKCLIEYALEITKGIERRKKAQERIKENKKRKAEKSVAKATFTEAAKAMGFSTLATIEKGLKERKENGQLLSEVLDTSQGGESETVEKDDRDRDKNSQI